MRQQGYMDQVAQNPNAREVKEQELLLQAQYYAIKLEEGVWPHNPPPPSLHNPVIFVVCLLASFKFRERLY